MGTSRGWRKREENTAEAPNETPVTRLAGIVCAWLETRTDRRKGSSHSPSVLLERQPLYFFPRLLMAPHVDIGPTAAPHLQPTL